MLFRRELRQNLKGFLITTAICSLLSLYLIALIPSMGAEMQEMLNLKMPKTMQLAFGMNGLDFSRPVSTYALMFSYLYLTLGIYAATLFGGIVAKEWTDKTAEYLFSLPARRSDLIRTKLLVAGGYLSVAVIFMLVVTAIGFAAVAPDGMDWGALASMGVAYWIGALFFGGLAFALSAWWHRARLAVGIVLGAYLLQVVVSLKGELDFMKWISPFDWFKGNAIAQSGHLDPGTTAVALLGTALCIYLGMRRFMRMDVLV